MRRERTSWRLPVASPAWMRLMVAESNTSGKSPSARERGGAFAEAFPKAGAESFEFGLLEALGEEAERFAGGEAAGDEIFEGSEEREALGAGEFLARSRSGWRMMLGGRCGIWVRRRAKRTRFFLRRDGSMTMIRRRGWAGGRVRRGVGERLCGWRLRACRRRTGRSGCGRCRRSGAWRATLISRSP